MRPRLVMTLAAGLLIAAGPDVESDEELRKFQGTWLLVSGEIDGANVSAAHVARSQMKWEGHEVILILPHQAEGPIRARIERLSPAKTPREIEWVRVTGPNAGKAVVGVYAFLGDDRFKICFDPSGKAVPKDFGAKKGSGLVYHVWKRAAKSASRARR